MYQIRESPTDDSNTKGSIVYLKSAFKLIVNLIPLPQVNKRTESGLKSIFDFYFESCKFLGLISYSYFIKFVMDWYFV